MQAHSARILPMQTAGTRHLIERTYREGSQFQWVRETLMNALEAGATRIEFGIEWQAVENQGVYRRMIADDGCGMTAEQLVEFFNTFGGGGKPIGGAHENFGVGSKTSLLPWNKFGMVVISWVDGDASMIWVAQDTETGEYGLKQEECAGPSGGITLEGVYDPYDDWASIKPDWIQDHGTVVVLLGNSATTDTVEGDPTRSESDIKGISSFLNRRFWEIPPGVDVFVDELRTTDREFWPPSEAIAHGGIVKDAKDRRTNTRRIEGAQYYIKYPPGFAQGQLGAHGTVPLRDGTEIDWFLWDGDRPKVHSYAAIAGYVATLYKNELYDATMHHSTYRSFGVSESAVRGRLWLIIRPIVDPECKRGIYPKTDRNSLLIKGGPSAGSPLPINEWANEFADGMPDELLLALRAARRGSSGTITDKEWREKLADRFGSRWRIAQLRLRRGGLMPLDPSGRPPLRRSKGPPKPEPPSPAPAVDVNRLPRRRNAPRMAKLGGSLNGEQSWATGGVPSYETVGAKDLGDGMLAAWAPKHPDHPEGAVLINVEHPVLRAVIEHWQLQYADHHADDIEQDVIDVYGQVAVSKIAHSEHLKGILPSQTVEKVLRSEEALTMALLGLMSEDQLLSTRIGGKYSKKRGVVSGRRAQKPTLPR